MKDHELFEQAEEIRIGFSDAAKAAEQELYDHLTLFIGLQDTPSERLVARTFLLHVLEETEDGFSVKSAIIDPGVPASGGPVEFMRMSGPQRAAVKAVGPSGHLVNDHLREAMKVSMLVEEGKQVVGDEKMRELLETIGRAHAEVAVGQRSKESAVREAARVAGLSPRATERMVQETLGAEAGQGEERLQ